MGESKKKKNKNKSEEFKLDIVTREEWGALSLPKKKIRSMKFPLRYVRYSYTNTKEENCSSYETCCKELREIQRKFREQRFPDLPYNFLIGADGRVYEGRGWYWDVERHISLRKFRKKCIDIAYIGEYAQEMPPNLMLDAAAEFVKYGIKLQLIKEMPEVETLNDYRDYLYYEDQER